MKTIPENSVLVGFVGAELPIDAWKGDLVPVELDGGGWHLYKLLPVKK